MSTLLDHGVATWIIPVEHLREAPPRPRDFDYEGDFDSLVAVCNGGHFVAYECQPGLWNVWQLPAVAASASAPREVDLVTIPRATADFAAKVLLSLVDNFSRTLSGEKLRESAGHVQALQTAVPSPVRALPLDELAAVRGLIAQALGLQETAQQSLGVEDYFDSLAGIRQRLLQVQVLLEGRAGV